MQCTRDTEASWESATFSEQNRFGLYRLDVSFHRFSNPKLFGVPKYRHWHWTVCTLGRDCILNCDMQKMGTCSMSFIYSKSSNWNWLVSIRSQISIHDNWHQAPFPSTATWIVFPSPRPSVQTSAHWATCWNLKSLVTVGHSDFWKAWSRLRDELDLIGQSSHPCEDLQHHNITTSQHHITQSQHIKSHKRHPSLRWNPIPAELLGCRSQTFNRFSIFFRPLNLKRKPELRCGLHLEVPLILMNGAATKTRSCTHPPQSLHNFHNFDLHSLDLRSCLLMNLFIYSAWI